MQPGLSSYRQGDGKSSVTDDVAFRLKSCCITLLYIRFIKLHRYASIVISEMSSERCALIWEHGTIDACDFYSSDSLYVLLLQKYCLVIYKLRIDLEITIHPDCYRTRTMTSHAWKGSRRPCQHVVTRYVVHKCYHAVC